MQSTAALPPRGARKWSDLETSCRPRLDLRALSRHTGKKTQARHFPISATQDLEAGGLNLAASLLFAPGERPDVQAVTALADRQGGYSVSFDPAADRQGRASAAFNDMNDAERSNWLELLANGLTFDMSGLAPGAPDAPPPDAHVYGLPEGERRTQHQALTLRPGPHLAEGSAMLPVIRSLAWLAALLTALPGCRAVAWHPARCWSAPGQFRDSVLGWVDGGPFPAFALAALAISPDGGMQSEGLSLFTGQELRLEPELTEDRASAGKLGVRLLHWLVEHGPVAGPDAVTGPDGARLRIEPSANTRFVRVWKG